MTSGGESTMVWPHSRTITPVSRRMTSCGTALHRQGLPRLLIADEPDREHHPDTANLADDRQRAQRAQTLKQEGADVAGPGEQASRAR